MAMPTSQPVRVAVDTNVPLDLAVARELVIDALGTIRQRTVAGFLLVPPSVASELAFIVDHGDSATDREAARAFLRNHRAWGFHLVHFLPVGEELVEQLAARIRDVGLLPGAEVHDSMILAEASVLDCSLLLTSDEHLRGIDFEHLTFELKAFDVIPPVIATPREIVQKFFR